MARLTAEAAVQVDALLDYYSQRGRDQAIRQLRRAVGQALTKIEANPAGGRSFPGPYRGVARWQYRWIKVHRYWFGYVVEDGEAVVTNVFFETADIQGRIVPRQPQG